MTSTCSRIAGLTTDFLVVESAAHMPASCWRGTGRYRKVAVVEVERGARPAMISARARGVVAIHSVADRLYDGKTERNAAGRARDDARHLVKQLARKSYMNAAHVSLAGCV